MLHVLLVLPYCLTTITGITSTTSTTSRSRSPRRATRPAAQQQQHSSSVGSMRPASSKPAQTFRTPKGRSRECRCPRAKPLGQFRIPTMQPALVQQAHCWLCKQAAIDLVDETKHVERVAPDHEHHDGADHDRHSTNISQQAAWCVLIGTSCCATFAAHKAGCQQAYDERLCNYALAGERAACSTYEPTSSHNRCGRHQQARPATSPARKSKPTLVGGPPWSQYDTIVLHGNRQPAAPHAA